MTGLSRIRVRPVRLMTLGLGLYLVEQLPLHLATLNSVSLAKGIASKTAQRIAQLRGAASSAMCLDWVITYLSILGQAVKRAIARTRILEDGITASWKMDLNKSNRKNMRTRFGTLQKI
jgi:hypothetical protein